MKVHKFSLYFFSGLIILGCFCTLTTVVRAAEDDALEASIPVEQTEYELLLRDSERIRSAVQDDRLEQLVTLQEEFEEKWSLKKPVYYGQLMESFCQGLAGRRRFGTAGVMASDKVAFEVLTTIEGITPESQLVLALCLQLVQPDLVNGEESEERDRRARLLAAAWERLQKSIEEDFDFSRVPTLNMEASIRGQRGPGPLTRREQELIDENSELIERRHGQRSLRDARSRYRDSVVSLFTYGYARSPDADDALRTILTEHDFSQEMMGEIFQSITRIRGEIKARPMPPGDSDFSEKPRDGSTKGQGPGGSTSPVETVESDPLSLKSSKDSPSLATVRQAEKVPPLAPYVAPADDAEYVAALVGKPRKLPGLEKVEKAVQRRIKNLREGGHVDEALIEARGFFNVCSTERTGRAVDLIAECLVQAHPDDPGIAKRFRLDQLAASYEWQKRINQGALDDSSLLDRPAPDATVVVTLPGPLPDYEVIIAQISGDDFDSRLARANVLLIAQRLPEARAELLAAYSIASDKQIPAATQGLARLIRAEDGHVGRANAWLLNIRPAN